MLVARGWNIAIGSMIALVLSLIPGTVSAAPRGMETTPVLIHRQTETLSETIIRSIVLRARALPADADTMAHAGTLTAALLESEKHRLHGSKKALKKLRGSYYEVSDSTQGGRIELALVKRSARGYDVARMNENSVSVKRAIFRREEATMPTFVLALVGATPVPDVQPPLVTVFKDPIGIHVQFRMDGSAVNARVSNLPPDFTLKRALDLLMRGLLPLRPESQPKEAQGDQGLQGGWAVDNNGSSTFSHGSSTQFGYMQQAGAGWVRINFRLGSCFVDWKTVGCTGATALDTYAQVVQNAHKNNLKVLGLLSNESWRGGQAEWIANNAENLHGSGDNPYIEGFARNAAGVLASYFGSQVTQWQVWNEPNAWTASPGPGVYSGGSFIYPSNFAWLLKQSYGAIKDANPEATVISGAIFSHDASTGADYLRSTYTAGATNAGWMPGAYPFDAVGQNVYIDQGAVTSSSNLSAVLGDLRRAYVSYEGDATSKLTYITEVGWNNTSVSPDVQAQNLQTAYTTFQSTSWVGRAFWFNVQDIPESRLLFGLVDTRGTPKPALAVYRRYALY